MNEQRINDLKSALAEIVELVTSSGEPVTEEIQTMLAQVMEHVASRIQQLRQEEEGAAGGLPPEAPPLEPGPFPSSNINAFKYDPDKQQLFVKFHGKDSADSGPTYSYGGVPPFIFDVFRRGAVGPKTSGSNRYHTWHKGVTPSLGASMAALIKNGGYPYQQVA